MSNRPDPIRDPVAAKSPSDEAGSDAAATPTATGAKPVEQLTPEEQMALYEKELKETDWGHQPC